GCRCLGARLLSEIPKPPSRISCGMVERSKLENHRKTLQLLTRVSEGNVVRMYFEQFYLTCLSHASYMLGSEGIAAVVDPQRDVGIYLEEARKNNLRIEHVIETHLHADFVSGHHELAARTSAKIYLGWKAGATFAHVPVHDGDEVGFGRCRLRFLETPGHTVES